MAAVFMNLLQIQPPRKNIIRNQKAPHRSNQRKQRCINHIPAIRKFRIPQINPPVPRNHQNNGVENLRKHVHPNISQNSPQNPVFLPKLANGNTGKEHQRFLKQTDQPVKPCKKRIALNPGIYVPQKVFYHMHKRKIPHMSCKQKNNR